MKNDNFFKQNSGRYRLVKFIIGGKDCSEAYANGWKDKSMYMFIEITEDGQFFLKVHSGGAEKEYRYFFDPEEMRDHLKEDHSDEGTPVTIENGVLTEETKDHTMIYELTNEPD